MKEETLKGIKDGVILLSIGIAAMWMLIKGEREEPEAKPEEAGADETIKKLKETLKGIPPGKVDHEYLEEMTHEEKAH